MRYEKIVAHLKAVDDVIAIQHSKGIYTTELSKNGFVGNQ
jgi:hypothetical protein